MSVIRKGKEHGMFVRKRIAIVPKDLPDGHVGVGRSFYEVVKWDGMPGDMEHQYVMDRFATQAAAEERLAKLEAGR